MKVQICLNQDGTFKVLQKPEGIDLEVLDYDVDLADGYGSDAGSYVRGEKIGKHGIFEGPDTNGEDRISYFYPSKEEIKQ